MTSPPSPIPDRDRPITAPTRPLPGAGTAAYLIAGLEAERQRQGLTRTEVARRMGVAPARISEWMSADPGTPLPRLDAIDRWLAALGLRVRLEASPAATLPVDRLTAEQLEQIATASARSRRAGKDAVSIALGITDQDGKRVFATSADLDAALALHAASAE